MGTFQLAEYTLEGTPTTMTERPGPVWLSINEMHRGPQRLAGKEAKVEE
jgi:hypothetical protein